VSDTETTIIALSGKKQSGKTTSVNWIVGTYMSAMNIVHGGICVDGDGRLWVTDIFGNNDIRGVFDLSRTDSVMINFLEKEVYPYVKPYSFADSLKQYVCMHLLGLTHEQCYGTNEQKNSPTHLKWENMPGVLTPQQFREFVDGVRCPMNDSKPTYALSLDPGGPKHGKWASTIDNYGIIVHTPGLMTGREVMQYVGTNIFRKMYSKVWAEETIKRIKAEKTLLAIITDCRFPDEVEVVKNAGGKVVRFTRAPFAKIDTHDSETALDKKNFDWKKFDKVIYNNKGVDDHTDKLQQVLQNWGCLPHINIEG